MMENPVRCFANTEPISSHESNRTFMLWVVRHEWPSRYRFVSNCCQHWAVLVLRSSQGATFAVLLLSREGVTQGCPLAMVAFGMAVTPLIRRLKREVQQVHQAWHGGDATSGNSAYFPLLRVFMERLVELGPAYG
jgi:hypothetical protein